MRRKPRQWSTKSIFRKLRYYMTKEGPELANAVRGFARQKVQLSKEDWSALK